MEYLFLLREMSLFASVHQFLLIRHPILYSYLMGVDAIDQTIYPSVLGMTKCSIAFGRWPHVIEHLVIPSGQIVWSIASTPIK